jgi:hypothetical protein
MSDDDTEYREKSKLAAAGEDIVEGLRKKSVGDVAYGVAGVLDALGPVGWSAKAWDWYYAKLKAAAGTDPVWRAIEDRRQVDGGGSKIFLSEDLTFADYDVQRSIERRLTPEPLWYKAVRRTGQISCVHGLGEMTARYQRGRRGWADSDVGDMDHFLARVTADMLEHLADTSYGWPDNAEFPTFEDWTACLRRKAQDLRSWVDGGEHGKDVDAWYTLARDPKADPAATKVARDTMWADDKLRYDGAKAAMAWVAEHLGQMWD